MIFQGIKFQLQRLNFFSIIKYSFKIKVLKLKLVLFDIW